MKNKTIKKTITYSTIIILLNIGIAQVVTSQSTDKDIIDEEITKIINESILDLKYIYNLTEALSNIIFTEYDEEAGELAKGRYFGSKGEHKAAEILYENMTELGLYATLEQIQNIPGDFFCKDLTHDVQILDYGLKINNESIDDFYISFSRKGTEENPKELSCNLSYKNLSLVYKKNEFYPNIWNDKVDKNQGDYLIFVEESFRNLDIKTPPLYRFLNTILDQYGKVLYYSSVFRKGFVHKYWESDPRCKGIICYDFNEDAYNMVYNQERKMPKIYINKSTGEQILENFDNTRVDFYINQEFNDSIICYNVIGQLNGTDPSKTVIVDCLYDSWWCQGTADSAIGMAMVLGIAKYFIDNEITPKYNIKFIGFGGEEVGCRGAKYYEAAHKDENIIYMIDLNQLGFKTPGYKLTLCLYINKLSFIKDVWRVAKKTNYVDKVSNTAYIKPIWLPFGAPSDDQMFVINRPKIKTVCFLKCFPWVLHHRDGLNHTEGDVLKYFDWADVSATGEIALNLTKYVSL
jgi:hypothetical protein